MDKRIIWMNRPPPLGTKSGACLAVLCVAALASYQTHGDIKGSVEIHSNVFNYASRANVSMTRAVDIASEKRDGRPVEAELEVENGYLVYDVVFATPDGKTTEHVIDAGTGEILASEPDDLVSSQIRSKFEDIRISLIDAIRETRSLAPGIITEIELEAVEGRLLYAITTWEESGKSHHLRIDARTGVSIE